MEDNTNFNYRKLILPHYHNIKQKKEMGSIYCLNVRILDFRNSTDPLYEKHATSVIKFIEANNSNQIVGKENVGQSFMKTAWRREQTETSIFWDVKFITPAEKKEVDKYLVYVLRIFYF